MKEKEKEIKVSYCDDTAEVDVGQAVKKKTVSERVKRVKRGFLVSYIRLRLPTQHCAGTLARSEAFTLHQRSISNTVQKCKANTP